MLGRIFFPLMLVLLTFNAAMSVNDSNWNAAGANLCTLICLGGWHNMRTQRDLKQAFLDDARKDLEALHKEINRG